MGRMWMGVAVTGAVLGLGLAVVAVRVHSRETHQPQPQRAEAPGAAPLERIETASGGTLFRSIAKHDVSAKLTDIAAHAGEDASCDKPGHGCGLAPPSQGPEADEDEDHEQEAAHTEEQKPAIGAAAAAIEQKAEGKHDAAHMVENFDGLGYGFEGPAGTMTSRSPSDNSLAVGPDHIVQIVNSRLAVFTKKGKKFDQTGKVIFGPVVTNSIFAGFGGQCENRTSGDAVVRYDQLAGRWLFVLPIFRRPPDDPQGPYSMCYAVSQGADPTGPYYRYEFKRPLFPDYPRPAIWPDGYYVPSSTGDTVIQKHACIADRAAMLAGKPATEQCVIVDGAGFLNNADIDGQQLPPAGAPNILLAAGGTQLHQVFEDDGIYEYELHVDWKDPSKTSLTKPVKIAVAPYHYLCNGQLTKCVPQPGTETRLDAQGDKLMQRLVYRRIGRQESILAVHSVSTQAGTGGVRWYEFRLNRQRHPELYQQGTYTPDGAWRWMGSMAMDKDGNIGVGYSYAAPGSSASSDGFVGQRFTGRLRKDPRGQMTLHENVLVKGEAAQTNTLRWEDYTTTAVDPSDDCTLWYVGDYVKAEAPNYTTRIGAFRLGRCDSKSRK